MPTNLPRLLVLLFLVLGQHLPAQCQLTWSSGGPQPQLSGYGLCVAQWDPDGAGPLPQRLVVGGQRLLGGAQLLGNTLPSTQRVMTWDGTTWEPLGGGPGGSGFTSVDALVVWNGELFAGGNFTTAGGPNHIARWDGSAWQPVGSGFPVPVRALTVWNNTVVAAGYAGAGTATTAILQQWNGTTWSALPSPPTLRVPSAVVDFEGELIVAGSQSLASAAAGVLERRNGTSWATSILAQSTIGSMVVRRTLAIGGSDTLIVGGSFTSIGSAAVPFLARTNGAPSFGWTALGAGLPNPVVALQVSNSGLSDYTVVARTTASSTPVMRFATSTGLWTSLGNSPLNAITVFNGFYHGVSSSNGDPACQRYDGSQWVPVQGPGIVGTVNAATRAGNDMVIGGTFATISGVAMNGIARWNGSTFTPLGSGMIGSGVDALVTLDNGDIVAGGAFSAAGGVAASNVARWNGTSWSAMGGGFNQRVHALCKLPNGDVVAGGAFTTSAGVPVVCNRVAKWNGSTWAPMAVGDLGMDNDVLALVVRGDGTLFAGGRFTHASTFSRFRVAQWNGTAWGQVGAGMNNSVHGLAARPNGDLIAVGEFTQASLQTVDRIARWNGSTWVPMGAASGDPQVCRAVIALANGDVVASRGFHQPTATVDVGISRWNGSTWNSMSFLTGENTLDPVDVRTIVQRADGDLVLGGNFHVADFTMSYALAALQSTCMPSAIAYGTGCSSAAGLLAINPDTLPWIGSTFRTTTTGVAANSFCLAVVGFTQLAIPLATVIAQGQPGCSLLASPDIVTLVPTGVGTAHFALTLANAPSLLGAQFFQQTVPLEFDVTAAIVAIRASNALAATIGTL